MWGREAKRSEDLIDVIDNCVFPSINSIADQLLINFGVDLFFNLVVRSGKLSYNVYHYFSMVCGIIILFFGLLGYDIVIHLSLLFCGYTILYYAYKLKRTQIGNKIDPIFVTTAICIIYMMYGEYYYSHTELWLRSRGVSMVAVMKIISIAYDFRTSERPSFAEYCGYLLCPANCMLGPWTTFDDYAKTYFIPSKLNRKWLLRIVKTVCLSFFFLGISNCFADRYIPEEHNWIIAYKKALCFRSGHYFVSYLSEAFMLTAGYNERLDEEWSFIVTNPFYVELPRSLATVVIYWNIAMHRFLKMYIYIVYLPYSSALAIFLTYFFSSLLHGLNIQIVLVLLSLGGFSYVQSVSQMFASRIFSSCVKIRPCTNCEHRFKTYHPITLIINFSFMIFNFIHLSYLGAVMNILSSNRSIYDTLVKWEALGFSSHHVFFMVFCIWWLFKGVPT